MSSNIPTDRWIKHRGPCKAQGCPCTEGSPENDEVTDKKCTCGHPPNFHTADTIETSVSTGGGGSSRGGGEGGDGAGTGAVSAKDKGKGRAGACIHPSSQIACSQHYL